MHHSIDAQEDLTLEALLVCCSVLQCVAVNVLQCVAVCCSECVAVCCSVLQCVAVCCSECVAVCCSVLQCVWLSRHPLCVAVSVLQYVAVCCSVFDSQGTPTVRGGGSARRPKRTSGEQEESQRDTKTHNTQINRNKRSSVNPKSTSNQSSKPCTVAQYHKRLKKSGRGSGGRSLHEAQVAIVAPELKFFADILILKTHLYRWTRHLFVRVYACIDSCVWQFALEKLHPNSPPNQETQMPRNNPPNRETQIPRYLLVQIKIEIWVNLNWYPGIWIFRSGGFRGCSIFSEIGHMYLLLNTCPLYEGISMSDTYIDMSDTYIDMSDT